MKFPQFAFLFLLFLALVSCADDDNIIDIITGEEPVDITGLTYVEDEDESLDDIYNNVKADLEAAAPIGIALEVNHSTSASGAGLSLRDTRVILFGNPALGTPLMQQNMLAGLDLPQKLVFYTASDDDVIVAYNSTEYLASRYNLTDDGGLTMIGNALKGFVEDNTGEEVVDSGDLEVDENEGIVINTSTDSVEVVYTRLRNAIEANPNLTIALELSHSDNAASVNLDLADSRLIVFGNPAVGTPFMQAEQTAGIDLPVKMLVFDDNGTTTIAWNDPAYLADRHDIPDDLAAIATMRMALDNLTSTALGN